MVVDTSALVAILKREEGWERLVDALAATLDEPLLFVGNDFARTDVESA